MRNMESAAAPEDSCGKRCGEAIIVGDEWWVRWGRQGGHEPQKPRVFIPHYVVAIEIANTVAAIGFSSTQNNEPFLN